MTKSDEQKIRELRLLANRIRQHVVSMTAAARSGHPGGALGMADVFAALYGQILRHDPKRPDWPDRDRLILSNGHICPARYAAMAETGYFPVAELQTLRRFGSRLQGHPERTRLPGVETTSGPLGAGLAQAAGLAYAARLDGKKWHTYCLTSDGEHDAGLHWEAVLFAAAKKLADLTCIVDRNNVQIDGHTEEVMPLEPLKEKYLSFGWQVIEIDGNDPVQVMDGLENAKVAHDGPTAIIAHNVLGKGVSFMEDDPHWHGTPPNAEQAAEALKELKTAEMAILKMDRK